MKRFSHRIVQLTVLLLCSAMVGAQVTPGAAPPRITPNWPNTDIQTVAEAVGAAIGKNFILDLRVRATINFSTTRPLSPTELYSAFLNILQVYGFAAVPAQGNIVKVVPDAMASKLPGNDLPANLNMNGDEIVTDILDTKYISALQLSQVLRSFLTGAGQIMPVTGTNSMIVTDRASNVRRLKAILTSIDRPNDTTIETVALENATAADVVKTIKALPSATPQPAEAGQALQVAADDRTNSILISGEPGQRLRAKALIATLDIAINNGGGTQVRYLHNTRAEKIAPKLKELATGVAAVAAGGATGAATTAAAAAAAADRSVSIIADEYTNSLVITAPPKTMRSLMAAVDKLDIALAQVSITAIVADVSDSKAADIGVNWAEFSNKDGTHVPASSFVSPVGTANGNPISIVDLIKDVTDPANATKIPLGATFAIGQLRDNGLNLGLMIRAMRADGNTNVILESNVTAMDNQEAKLENAQEVPFITGQYSNSNGGGGGGGGNNGNVNPFTTVQRQKVGTILTVTPQINGSNEMILTINLESSELTGAVGDSGSLITNTRTVKTAVRVASGDTIVLGGLIKDTKITGENRMPYLSRIPILGELFKARNGKREKSNLMVFIRPTIMMDGVQAAAQTTAKYNVIRDAELRQNDKKDMLPVLPAEAPPLLPELQFPSKASVPAANTKP